MPLGELNPDACSTWTDHKWFELFSTDQRIVTDNDGHPIYAARVCLKCGRSEHFTSVWWESTFDYIVARARRVGDVHNRRFLPTDPIDDREELRADRIKALEWLKSNRSVL